MRNNHKNRFVADKHPIVGMLEKPGTDDVYRHRGHFFPRGLPAPLLCKFEATHKMRIVPNWGSRIVNVQGSSRSIVQCLRHVALKLDEAHTKAQSGVQINLPLLALTTACLVAFVIVTHGLGFLECFGHPALHRSNTMEIMRMISIH